MSLSKFFIVILFTALLFSGCSSREKASPEKADPINVRIAGMFSNAELARATGGNLEMHNLLPAW